MERVRFDEHPVYSQFIGDSRFKLGEAGHFVDIVFEAVDAELLWAGKLTVDAVQDFGEDEVVRCGTGLAIVFSLGCG